MDYKLKIGETTIPIEVNTSTNDKLNFIISEKGHKVDYSLIDDHHIHLNINGKRINAYVVSDDTGKTITRLAPIGKAMVNNTICEAKSTANFIDENTEITVVKLNNNQINPKIIKTSQK